jgi:hypothetical protein
MALKEVAATLIINGGVLMIANTIKTILTQRRNAAMKFNWPKLFFVLPQRRVLTACASFSLSV